MSDTVKHGAHIIMALDYGNFLYDTESPRKNYSRRDWPESHVPQPWKLASLPTASPETMNGFLNYTRFMVRHFRDRVMYFEIWNEENAGGAANYGWGETPAYARVYMKLVKAAVPVIRQ